jgi:hypothetical protein
MLQLPASIEGQTVILGRDGTSALLKRFSSVSVNKGKQDG